MVQNSGGICSNPINNEAMGIGAGSEQSIVIFLVLEIVLTEPMVLKNVK